MDSVQLRLFLLLKATYDDPAFRVPHIVALNDLDFIRVFVTPTTEAAWVQDAFARYTSSLGNPLRVVLDHAAHIEMPNGDIERFIGLLIMTPSDDEEDEDEWINE